MTDAPAPWIAIVRVHTGTERTAAMLERSLRPEAEREVPRARATLARPDPRTLELSVSARDGGAMRAALNTYLGWVSLSVATLGSARPPSE